MVACRAHNPKVVGSSPTSATKRSNSTYYDSVDHHSKLYLYLIEVFPKVMGTAQPSIAVVMLKMKAVLSAGSVYRWDKEIFIILMY